MYEFHLEKKKKKKDTLPGDSTNSIFEREMQN